MKYNQFGALSGVVLVLAALAVIAASFASGAFLAGRYPSEKDRVLDEVSDAEATAWQERKKTLEERIADARKWLGQAGSPYNSVKVVEKLAEKHHLILGQVRAGEMQRDNYYVTVPITIEAHGSYLGLRNFIDEVQRSVGAQTITRLSLAASQQLDSFDRPSIRAIMEMRIYGCPADSATYKQDTQGKTKQIRRDKNLFAVPLDFYLGKAQAEPNALVAPGEQKQFPSTAGKVLDSR